MKEKVPKILRRKPVIIELVSFKCRNKEDACDWCIFVDCRGGCCENDCTGGYWRVYKTKDGDK